MSFLNRKISTLAGIIIILLIASSIGAFIIWQANKIAEIRIEAIEKQSGLDL